MTNRKMVPMSSIIKSISMGPFGSDVKVEYMRESGMPIIDGSNLTTTKMNWEKYRFLDIDRAKKMQSSLAHKGDIIVTHRGTIGQLSYVPEDCPFDEFLISQSQFRVTLDTVQVNPVYFAYYFNTSEGQKRLLSFANYVGVPALASATTNFKELEFPLIPITEQNKVASLIENIDSKIENNNKICDDLEAMAKLIYEYWFVQFDFPDGNGKPYKSSGGKMIWNDKLRRELPEGWGVLPIGNMISTERGLSYSTPNIKSGQGIPMLNLATFMPGGGEYKADGLKHYLGDYPRNKVLQPYDLIMCNTQQTAIKFETDIIGRAMLVPDIFIGDVVFSHHVNVIRTHEESMKYYLLYLFNSDYYHKYISGFTNGTNILGLSFNGVEDYLTEVPTPDLLKKFGEVVLDVEKKKSEIIVENQQLASLRDFLLPMLMNGQVKVNKAGA